MDTTLKREHQGVVARIVMQEDLRGRSIERIHTLHLMADPDYKKLIKTRRESLRPVWGSLDTVIYYDILDVIVEALKSSSELRSSFIELYRPVYPKVDKVIEKVKSARNEREFFNSINGPDDGLCKYAIFCMGELDEFDKCPIWIEPIEKVSRTRDIYFEAKDYYSQAVFDNTEEPVIDSPAFKTYIKKNIQKIADFLKCDVGSLSQEITKMFIEGLKEEEIGESNGTVEMTARIERKLIMAYHQGSNSLFVAMHRKNPSWFRSYYYEPDVNHIIEDYYTAKAMTVYYGSEMGEFSKLSLTRGCITENPERDLKEILTLCNMDVIYKMFDVLMDLHYENFSWDKIDRNKSSDIISANIKKLESQIEIFKSRIEKMRSEISALHIQHSASNNEAIRAFEVENKKLRDQVEELQKKSGQQKEIIDAQEDLIEVLQQTVDDGEEGVNLARLQTYRFLFVGYLDTYLTELKSLFPNSIFMTNVNKDIAGIQADYIVFITRYLSHSMYYKVKSSPLYLEIPSINSNATSVAGVLKELERGVI